MLAYFLMLLFSTATFQTDQIILEKNWKSVDVAKNSLMLAAEDFPDSAKPFYPFSKDSLNYEQTDIWLLFTIKNAQPITEKVYLECYLMDHITLYKLQEDSSWAMVEKSGYLIPSDQKPFPKTNLNILPFSIAENESATYLFHIHNESKLSTGLTKSTFSLGVKLLNEDQVEDYQRGELLLDLFLGALLIMFIYNISFYFFTRFDAYLFFAFYNFSVFTVFFFLGGYAIDYQLFTDMDNERMVKYIACIVANASYAPFIISFLKLKQLSKINYWIQLVIFITCLSSVFLVLGGKLHQALIINAISTAIMFLSIPFATSAVLKKGLSSARFFLMGSIVVFFGITFFYLGYFQVIDFLMARSLFAIFSIGELAVLSLIIGYEQRRILEEVNELTLKETLDAERIKFFKEQGIELEEQLTSKKRELTAQVMRIANTNDSLSKIKQQLTKAGKTGEKIDSKKIIGELEELLASEDEWSHFTTLFNEIHPDFYNRIEKKFSNLTTNELKLIGYLKMNLKNGEIASILNVSTKAVTQANHRLRKKLGIPTEVKIVTFLNEAIEEL